MDLIEQLGGYEKAKAFLNATSFTIDELIMMQRSGLRTQHVEKALLEYRRQHNIFEKGDPIVFDISKPFCAKLQPDLMEVINPTYQEHDMIVRIDNQIYVVGGKAVRHATDAEIKAGKRLEVNDAS